MKNKQKSVLYLINSFSSGGAERGILSLLNNGLFDEVNLKLTAIHKGTGTLHDELAEIVGKNSIDYCTENEKLSIRAMCVAFFYIAKQLIRNRPDYLILSLTQSNLIGCFLAIFFPRIKVISFLHNTTVSKKIYRILLWLVSWRVDICLYDTKQTAEANKKLFIKRKNRKWFYVPLCSVNNSTIKTDYPLHTPISILGVGRINEQKNYQQAIHAIDILKQSGLNIHYSIAGEGDDDELNKLIESLNLKNSVTLLGHVDNWTELCQDTDIFLLSSIYEGLSIVTIEAMACGLPVVATNVGGIEEYGKHQNNMIKAKSPSAQDISNALAEIINDGELRKKIAIQAAKDANKLFGEQKVRSEIAEVRKELF